MHGDAFSSNGMTKPFSLSVDHTAPDGAGVPQQSPFEGKHICFVVNADWFFLSHRLQLAQAAMELGAEATVIAGDSGKASEIESYGLRFVPLPIDRPGMNPFRELRTLLALYKAYRRLKPDLVHHVTLKPVVYGSIAARSTDVVAVVNAVSGLGYAFAEHDRASVMRVIIRPLLRIALASSNSLLIVQNRSDFAFFVEQGFAPIERTVLIRGSGVSTKRFRPTPEPPGPAIVILPARMLWDKGVGEFVEAARLLREKGLTEPCFALVGAVDEGNRAVVPRERIESWVREGVVEWWGHRTDMAAVYSRSHVVALPTYYGEGLPKVLLEAAACGRTIVATNVPGCREFVRDGETGLLVEPHNVSALASALERALTEPRLRDRLRMSARRAVVQDFGIARVVRDTMLAYARLLSATAEP